MLSRISEVTALSETGAREHLCCGAAQKMFHVEHSCVASLLNTSRIALQSALRAMSCYALPQGLIPSAVRFKTVLTA